MGTREFTEAEIAIDESAMPGQSALREVLGETTGGIEVNRLGEQIARHHGIRKSDLFGPSRHPHVVKARADLYYVLRAQGWSSVAIGRAVGGRDHTTVLDALKKRKARCEAHVIAAANGEHGLRHLAGAPLR